MEKIVREHQTSCKIGEILLHFCIMNELTRLLFKEKYPEVRDENLLYTLRELDAGSTIPFLSRYRKEKTGGMDEVQIENLMLINKQTQLLEARKKSVREALMAANIEISELYEKIDACVHIQELEDLYLPYKSKRKTRANLAEEAGLGPLAALIMKQDSSEPEYLAKRFIKAEIKDEKAALSGAMDIIAAWANEHVRVRKELRYLFQREAFLHVTVVKAKQNTEEALHFKDYFKYSQLLRKVPAHRLLAILRGSESGYLTLHILPEEEKAIRILEAQFIRRTSPSSELIRKALKDGYTRLLLPSLEKEFLRNAKLDADISSIRIFGENFRQLLLAPPLGEKRILGIDPGFRSGCKLVCIDSQGDLLYNETIYPHAPQQQTKQSMAKIYQLVETYKIDAIAIGNGTAGRETEQLLERMRFPKTVEVYVVSENGASVYSASKVARQEFPNYDVTVRGAVSIARRLQDPLAELVKIDPKSIGVGQYQHDVDQTILSEMLDQIVVSCVNQVGIHVNTASSFVLRYVSGLGPSLAESIVAYRKEHGPFKSRKELLNVPRLGEKAYEQSAGFLRIRDGDTPLDNTGVHPERYGLIKLIAKDLGMKVEELAGNKDIKKQIDPAKYINDETGVETLEDIIKELERPGLDPRKKAKILGFDKTVHHINDLKEGMILPGIITNITAFGAFVDVGIKQDGLVHLSQLADQYVSNPLDIVKLHQHVRVKVLEIDVARKRIAYSMKGIQEIPPQG